MAKLSKKQLRTALISVSGVGAKTADKVLDLYSTKLVSVLEASPEKVSDAVRGVSLKRALAMRDSVRNLLKAQSPEAAAEKASEGVKAEVSDAAATEHPGKESRESPGKIDEKSVADAAKRRAAETSDSTNDETSENFLTPEELRQFQSERWADVHAARRRAEAVLRKYQYEILTLPNVHGVHVGFRRRSDKDGGSKITKDMEICIRIHVARKFRLDSAVFADERFATKLKNELDGIPVDICQLKFRTLEDPDLDAASIDQPQVFTRSATPIVEADPLVGGVEIATQSAPTNRGTLGGIVFHGFRPMMITNAHVAGKDAVVIQPGLGSKIGDVEMSELSSSENPGPIDCAIIRSDLSRVMEQTVKDLPPPQRFSKSALDVTDVHKTEAIMVGAISGLQSGTVKSVSAAVKIGNAVMPNQIIVESDTGDPIIAAGDSGSWLLTRQRDRDGAVFGYNVVGLVHARNEDGTKMVATHFQDIATRFGVTISLPS